MKNYQPRRHRGSNPTPPAVQRPAPPSNPPPAPMRISSTTMGRAMATDERDVRAMLQPPKPPPGIPDAAFKIAQDACGNALLQYGNDYLEGIIGDGLGFIGFQTLAQLFQRWEYRTMTDTFAEEMTRKFVKITSKGQDADEKKISKIQNELERHKIAEKFKLAAEHDGEFGGGQIMVKIKGTLPRDYIKPLLRVPETIKKGSLEGFQNIEPMWSYPGNYNSSHPIQADWYIPKEWYVMTDRVSNTRMMNFVSRPVADLLKPSYSFRGISMTQLAIEYVNNWLRTRNSVGDLLHSFSLTILKTNMAASLQGGSDPGIFDRARLFNLLRDTRGLMLCDFGTEEVEQLNTPLSTLDVLQIQALQALCAVSGIPIVKFLGTTPSGLGASTDGEIVAFYDRVKARQIKIYNDPMQSVIELIQLDQYGVIDPGIGFEWEPLRELDDEAQSRVRKTSAESDQVYYNIGAVSAEEIRAKVAADPSSGYSGLDLTVMPEPPDEPDEETEGTPGSDDA